MSTPSARTPLIAVESRAFFIVKLLIVEKVDSSLVALSCTIRKGVRRDLAFGYRAGTICVIDDVILAL
jgi:hypothetical protein